MAQPAGDLWSLHDLLQPLRSVDDGLVSLICPTCQTSTSALDECRLLCMGLFFSFLGLPPSPVVDVLGQAQAMVDHLRPRSHRAAM